MIDSHCHLADEAFSADLDAVIDRARATGVRAALCIVEATSQSEQARAALIRQRWPAVEFAAGIHPHQAGAFRERVEEVEPTLDGAIRTIPASCAIGEIGLDYHYDFAPRDVQQEVFRRQVRFARDRGLPVAIHTREADADTLAILEDEGNGQLRGVFHCFTGDVALARRVLDLGFHLSFSGIVTFRRAEAVREAARLVPIDRLLVETDAPYLAPVPHRGHRNEPAWVGHVIDGLSQVRRETPANIAAGTSSSFQELFEHRALDPEATEVAKGLLR